jgi:signal transduction histidine kinase
MRTHLGVLKQVFSGLRFRLFILVVVACTPLVALILHTAGEDRRRAEANWQRRSRMTIEIARREEQEVISAARQLLLAISESAPVRTLNPRRCKRWLDELQTAYPRYGCLGLALTNGSLIACTPASPTVTNISNLASFRNALQKRSFAVSRLAESSRSRPCVSFAYPILDHSDQVQAVVFAELDLRRWDRSGSGLPGQLPAGATWTQIDRSGTILARYPAPERWIGRPLPEPWLVTNAFQRTGVFQGPDFQGVPYFYASAKMPSRFASGEAAVILGIPRQRLFAEADRALQRNLTWLGIAAGGALVLGWAGSKLLILRPVRALVRSSMRLAAGDLSVRTGIPPSRDELGQLTAAFDQMAQALEQRELERQRTSRKLQELSHRVVEVQESERRHIARELHDEIGQSLTAAEMNLQAALQMRGTEALEQRLEESIQAVERVLEQVHDLSLNLRPSMLDDLGLEPALRWYTHRQAALTGLKAEFRSDPLEERLDPMVETECFRVAQEALTNVVRHAQARSVKVDLTRRNGHLHLTVRDDGVGFDVRELRNEAVRGASLGLLSMEERAALAGGGLKLDSEPGQGTEVHAWFPLNSETPKGLVEDR